MYFVRDKREQQEMFHQRGAPGKEETTSESCRADESGIIQADVSPHRLIAAGAIRAICSGTSVAYLSDGTSSASVSAAGKDGFRFVDNGASDVRRADLRGGDASACMRSPKTE
jgi:hypothetical protein